MHHLVFCFTKHLIACWLKTTNICYLSQLSSSWERAWLHHLVTGLAMGLVLRGLIHRSTAGLISAEAATRCLQSSSQPAWACSDGGRRAVSSDRARPLHKDLSSLCLCYLTMVPLTRQVTWPHPESVGEKGPPQALFL